MNLPSHVGHVYGDDFLKEGLSTRDIHDQIKDIYGIEVSKYERYTISYEQYIFTLAHKNTIKNESDIIGTSEGTCQRIYNHYSIKHFVACKPEPLRLLGIDDIATKKGHNYDTIIYNQETGKVVAILFSRKKEDVVFILKTYRKM